MIKYNIVVCFYGKILVNVAAYVIFCLCVCGVFVRSKWEQEVGVNSVLILYCLFVHMLVN